MGDYTIRLSSMLSFDENQEKDIINAVNALNASHQTGKFISNLIRIAVDNPEILDISNGRCEKGALIKQMDSVGMTYQRNQFINSVTKEVDAMKKKVDDIYDKVMNLYLLVQMGKHLGLEQKVDNSLSAAFIIEKQVKELQDSLGIALTSSVFASNKKEDAKKRADDAFEYILNTYSDIVVELKNQLTTVQQVAVLPVESHNNVQSVDIQSVDIIEQTQQFQSSPVNNVQPLDNTNMQLSE